MLWLLTWLVLAARVAADQPHYFNDKDYDGGFYGQYPHQNYHSENLTSPRLNVVQPFSACDDGSYIFIAPRGKVAPAGPMILDANGTLIWTSYNHSDAYNLRVQSYRGANYLTFWVGDDTVRGHGEGEYVMLDQSYKEVRRISAGNGLRADLHEFLITEQDTALVSIYDNRTFDLKEHGSLFDPGYVWDSMFQELDLETGKVLFEWRATDHFDIAATYQAIGKEAGAAERPWDWYHINSVDKDAAGNYLISSRYLRHLAYINGKTGEVEWTLGGKTSNFTDPSDSASLTFAAQHDARWHDGHQVITLFDNGADVVTAVSPYSRGMRIVIDEQLKTATLEVEYIHPLEILSTSQGSMQLLPNGNVLLGYGFNGAYTEFDPNGTAICDVRLQPALYFNTGDVQSYRTMKQNWTGTPDWPPKLVYYANVLYASWLGSTEVRGWLLQASAEADGDYYDILSMPKQGFETTISTQHFQNLGPYFRVQALDANGAEIGVSDAMDLDVEKAAFLAEEAARARDTWGILIAFGVLLITAISAVVAVCSCCGPRTMKWLLRKEGEEDDSSDDDSEYEDEWHTLSYRLTGPFPQTQPQVSEEPARPQRPPEPIQRHSGRTDGLELSDTDISDDEDQTLIPSVRF